MCERERRGSPVLTLLVVVALIGFVSGKAGAVEVPKLGKPHSTHRAPPGPGVGARPTSAARREIPAGVLAIYRARSTQAQCPGLSWTVLAGIGAVESGHGQSRARGVHSGHNYAGAAGPMQMGNGTGKAGNAWARYGRGGNIYDPADAIPAAARYLCGHGAPGNVRRAVYGYNPDWGYVANVMGHARRYGRP